MNTSLIYIDSRPAISYTRINKLLFVIGSNVDGTGWNSSVVDNNGSYNSMTKVNDRPAISYSSSGQLKYAIYSNPDVLNSIQNDLGFWSTFVIDAGVTVTFTSLSVINGIPHIAYFDNTNRNLKVAISSSDTGTGIWTLHTIDSGGEVGVRPSLTNIDGKSAITYNTWSASLLKYATASAPIEWFAVL